MATGDPLVLAELHYSVREELDLIQAELQKAEDSLPAYYDGMIEATLPLSSILALAEQHILMDFPAGGPPDEGGGLEFFGERKPVVRETALPDSPGLRYFMQQAASTQIDLESNTIRIKEDPEKDKGGGLESLPASDGDTGLAVLTREEEKEETAPATAGLYLVRLKGPLDASFRNALREQQITLTSFTEGSQLYCYKSFLDPSQYMFLNARQQVAAVAEFAVERKITGSLANEITAASESGLESMEYMEFELALSDEQYREQLVAFINNSGQGIVTEAGAGLIRLQTSTGSALLAALAGSPYVVCVSPHQQAGFYCDISKALIGVEFKTAAMQLTGEGETVCIIDSGVDTGHPDLKPQLKSALNFKQGQITDQAGHGTHVAGIICGNGASSANKPVKITGVAPGIQLVSVGIRRTDGNLELPPDMKELFALGLKEGARIFNISLGRKVASQYHLGSLSVDQFIYDNPEVLVVVAAGNEGKAEDGVLEYATLGSPATAKNALTVGAICGKRTQPAINLTWGKRYPANFPSPPQSTYPMMSTGEEPALTSSSGPSDYNSIKPEVVAPGTFILSVKASSVTVLPSGPEYYDDHYTFKTGTSMAAPFVSGMAALLREFLRKEHQCSNPSSALLKAIIVACAHKINTNRQVFADTSLEDIGFPDFDQGFGLVNLDNLVNSRTVALHIRDIYNNTNDALESRAEPGGVIKSKRDYNFSVPDNAGDIAITLTWIDEPARGIQNNLQLALQPFGKDWVLGNHDHLYQKDARFGSMSKVFNQLMDKNNNTEKIILANAAPGKYKLRVMAQNTLSKQGYSLAIVGNISDFAEARSAV